VALSALIIAWIPSEVLYRLKGGIKSKEDGITSNLIGSAMLGNMVMLPLLGYLKWGAIAWHATAISALGLAITTLGVFLRYWAILTLGRFFTSAVMVLPEHQVVQTGPFRLIRHPGYTGVLLFGLGIALAFANPLAAVWFLGTQGPALLFRIKVEESVLGEALGEAYQTYRRRTWKLLPYVY
jgi:protein-S-isoprenylcysteine O-methyltransferase Ste14